MSFNFVLHETSNSGGQDRIKNAMWWAKTVLWIKSIEKAKKNKYFEKESESGEFW